MSIIWCIWYETKIKEENCSRQQKSIFLQQLTTLLYTYNKETWLGIFFLMFESQEKDYFPKWKWFKFSLTYPITNELIKHNDGIFFYYFSTKNTVEWDSLKPFLHFSRNKYVMLKANMKQIDEAVAIYIYTSMHFIFLPFFTPFLFNSESSFYYEAVIISHFSTC